MATLIPPEAVAVEVVATQPTDADNRFIAQLDREEGSSRPPVAYIVKVALKSVPEATAAGWALYVGDLRIPKYWAYVKGIYFKVFDAGFFAQHNGEKLRFSADGTEFLDTGLKLVAPRGSARQDSLHDTTSLPRQSEVLR
ncbi:hypothetical protein QTH97_32390 [Variovorax sp. J22R24]|uniref:hypothetical protein n=1 Tax=Variovorax gracilis TaxID=3053502 RepID=UPI002578886F|nr:hypothetical protein [Variovorax sp. J22R24]MDM0109658.1 hypothetical protein [Variovorax sp. J22R24]